MITRICQKCAAQWMVFGCSNDFGVEHCPACYRPEAEKQLWAITRDAINAAGVDPEYTTRDYVSQEIGRAVRAAYELGLAVAMERA